MENNAELAFSLYQESTVNLTMHAVLKYILVEFLMDSLTVLEHINYWELGNFYFVLGNFYCELGKFICELGNFYCELGKFFCELGKFICELGNFYCELKTIRNNICITDSRIMLLN